MKQNLTVLAALLGSLSLRAAQETNTTLAEIPEASATLAEAQMDQDSTQSLNQVDNSDADDDMNADDLEAAENPEPIKPLEPRTFQSADYDVSDNGISTRGVLNDEDARCYSARYQDIDALLDPQSQFASIGLQQGRLGTCAKRLTKYEAQRYLDKNPEISRMFGRNGDSSVQNAKEHWKNTGYKNSVYQESIVDKDNKPFKCASKANESCKCPGTMWYGVSTRPDSKAPIETFDEMREWKTVSIETDDWQSCSTNDFGTDPMPGIDKQCFCEVKPAYEASRCADEGDDCTCNGHVYFAAKQNDNKELADFTDVLDMGFAIVDAQGQGSISCSSESFKNSDPAPNSAKQCFCDDRKTFTTQESITNIMEYWHEQALFSSEESEIKIVSTESHKASKYESDYASTVSLVSDIEFTEADAGAASCESCDKECTTDTEMTIESEIEKQKSVITKKYTKQKETNKQKLTVAETKKVESQTYCNSAQKTHDASEKKKYLQQCANLKIESQQLITQVEIERTQIEESERKEEKILVEETQEIMKQKHEKTITTSKTSEINKSILQESETSRITQETEERIHLIKNKIETEKIEQHHLSTQTTTIEKQVTNVQVQIEDIENQLFQQIISEKEESFEAGETTDYIAKEADEELNILIEKKKTDLTEQKTKVTSKIETLTSKTTDLETTVDTSTKTITETNVKIDTISSKTSTLIQQKMDLKHQIKIVSVSEQSKIQEQIDKITTTITESKKEVEELTTTREEAIIEETTARTEISYISEQIKTTELLEEKIEEQITVSEVVIDSRKEEVTENTEKVSIIDVQISAFKKKQELSSKIEEVRQFKSSINSKITKKTSIKEVTETELSTVKEELKVIEANIVTYEEQLTSTKIESEKKIIQTKIDNIKKENETIYTSYEKLNKTIETITTELEDLTSGKIVTEKEESIKTIEKEVIKINQEACSSLTKLPLVKQEVTTIASDGTTSTVSSSTIVGGSTTTCTNPGVISGITINGNLGGSSTTTTSTSTTDISTQIIQKQEIATKLREESTRIKEVATIKKEELEEKITSSKKVVEKIEETITTEKEKLTELKAKDKQITTKITTSTDTVDIESLNKELSSISTQITSVKEIIKTETSKKTEQTTKITDSTHMVTEMTSKIENAEEEAKSAEEEAITFISEGIEATYVVQKKREFEKKETEYKSKTVEYKQKKIKHEEEISTYTRQISEYKSKITTYKTEKKNLKSKIESIKKRIETVTKEEVTVLEKEITSIETEISSYEKYITETTTLMTSVKTTLTDIKTSWKTYYSSYTKLKATSYNSQQKAKEVERTRVNRVHRKQAHSAHIQKTIRIKENAIRQRHSFEETKKTVTKKTQESNKQLSIINSRVKKSTQYISKLKQSITDNNKMVTDLQTKIITSKSSEQKAHIEEDIRIIGDRTSLIKQTIGARTTILNKQESEVTTITSKISTMSSTLSRLEYETEKIETEAKSTEVTMSSEATEKVNKQIKMRREARIQKIKDSLKSRMKKLTKIVEEKEKKIETNTKKIVEQTKKISSTTSTLSKVSHVNEIAHQKNQYAGCSRMIMEEPTYFDLNQICSVTYSQTSSSMISTSLKSTQLTAQSLTCQMCYTQKPSCTAGAQAGGVSVVSFSVNNQGEANALTESLKASRKIADVNYISEQVNRKYISKGMVTSDPSQVRVQVITTTGKAQQVVDAITSWRTTSDKSVKGMDNDCIVSPLSGASGEYINSVIKATGYSIAQSMVQKRAITPRTMQAQTKSLQSLTQSESTDDENMESMISALYS